MIERKNVDGSTSWIPLDPGNNDYKSHLVSLIDPKLPEDEFFQALRKEADRLQDAAEAQALADKLQAEAEQKAEVAAEEALRGSIVKKLKLTADEADLLIG
jgi:uncharacterized membrane protein YgcG